MPESSIQSARTITFFIDDVNGEVRTVYGDDVKDILKEIGTTTVKRASNIEPVGVAWIARVNDGTSFLTNTKDEAVNEEVEYLETEILPYANLSRNIITNA